ncbi:prefoldin subunit beta [Methanogenium marinum]|uniref:Prefoldin subunit beta n=1 Tax=Methanogenium marinum TaxID=348610 RepID=A0A9Q4PWP1_9EURY|nr:prefoldin subunit beta [Methanogenium marinum]MDE4907586.1 prefoldin subunit beta [Methanogenium marinum]
MNGVSPKVQNQIAMIQQVQQQLGTIIQQKSQFEMMAKEARKAEAELGSISEESEVYVTIGTVMMKQDRDKVIADLTEKTETLELRIKSLEKQEKALTSKFEQLQAQIKSALESVKTPSMN